MQQIGKSDSPAIKPWAMFKSKKRIDISSGQRFQYCKSIDGGARCDYGLYARCLLECRLSKIGLRPGSTAIQRSKESFAFREKERADTEFIKWKYIYYGSSSMDNSADLKISGEATDDNLGRSVSTAGDVNGDGYDDIIVGAPENDSGGSGAGAAYIFLGGSSMDNTADIHNPMFCSIQLKSIWERRL